MDREKTGAPIAAARKEKNMTQRDLAERLHVSDRAVSKWERGAGFPDVGLLEPLAESLELNVLDLLRGERTEELDVHAAVKEALDAFQEKRRQTRRYVLGEIARVLAFLLVCGGIVSLLFPLRWDVGPKTVTAGVYRDGELLSYTTVETEGEAAWELPTGSRWFYGRFAIECLKWTCREDARASISRYRREHMDHLAQLEYSVNGWFGLLPNDNIQCFSKDWSAFALRLPSPEGEEDVWYVLATSPQMYETYRAEFEYWGYQKVPPELTSPQPDWRDDVFPPDMVTRPIMDTMY